MKNLLTKKLLPALLAVALQTWACPALAQSLPPQTEAAAPKLDVYFSPYTLHYSEDGSHKNVLLFGVEREHADHRLDGLALFTNSFGQNSAYLYPWGGVYKDIGGVGNTFIKWTAGVLYGYLPPYDNKVPLNYKGFSPGAIFAVGYTFRPGWSAQVNLLGTAGLMFQVSATLN